MASQASELGNSNSLVNISNPLDATLDIIAVHGINITGSDGHAENTWTHDSSNVNWLRSLLPDTVPFARILAFQYNANVAFGTSIAGVKEQAINLLGCLRQKRKSNPTRPIIFIAHSLGGIIVKESLATAYREHEAYPMIWTFTYGIFFLAVPHMGSSYANFGEVLANIYSMATGQPRNLFLRSLGWKSDDNEDLNNRFKPLHSAYKFYSWIEGLPLGQLGIIVSKESATLGMLEPQETQRVANRDHRTICKFENNEDPEWQQLSKAISEAARTATCSSRYSPTMPQRQLMITTEALNEDEQEEPVSIAEASTRALDSIAKVNKFFISREFQMYQSETDGIYDSLRSLAYLLLVWVGPILAALVTTINSNTWVADSVSAVALSTLPSRELALKKAQEGQLAEEKLMEAETWAIDRLNVLQREALQEMHQLQAAIRVHRLAGNTDSLQLEKVDNLRRDLSKQIVRFDKELHQRHQSYNRAEAVRNEIQRVRDEGAEKGDREFWIQIAEVTQKHQVKDKERRCCVVL